MFVTLFRSLVQTQGEELDFSFDELTTLFESKLHDEFPASETSHSGWSAARFKDQRRAKSNVISVSALVLDFDGGESPTAVHARWSRYRHLIQSTRKSTASAPRFRLIVPLSRPVTAVEYERLWACAAEREPNVDKSTRDASRFWFQPGSYAPQDAFALENETGEPLDPDNDLIHASLEIACRRIAEAKPGARNATLNAEAFACKAAGVPRSIAAPRIEAAASAIGLDAVEISKTIASAYDTHAPLKLQSIAKPEVTRSEDVFFTRGDQEEIACLIQARATHRKIIFSEWEFWQYDAARGLWVVYPESAFAREIMALAGSPVSTAGGKSSALKIQSATVDGVLKLLKYKVSSAQFRTSDAGVTFTNCRLTHDGKTLHTAAAQPSDAARYGLNFAYDEHAQSPLFRQLIASIFGHEDDPRALWIQEFAGACLFGQATKYQQVCLLFGDGRNGKSTLLTAIESAFPVGTVSHLAPKHFTSPVLVESMRGSLVNVANELPGADLISSPEFKQVVTGETMTLNRKYKDPIETNLRAGHFFAANKLPATNDTTDGFFRRFCVIPLTKKFIGDERIMGLSDVIARDEAPGIAAWCVRGYERLVSRGRYVELTESTQAVDEWKTACDSVALFVSEHFEHDPAGTWKPAQLYLSYRNFALDSGYKPVAQREFARRLSVAGIESRVLNGNKMVCLRWKDAT